MTRADGRQGACRRKAGQGRRPSPPRAPARGYVLVSVLAALVVLSLVALRLDDRVERWRGDRGAWSDWQAERHTLASAGQSLLACLLTRPLGPRGFGPEPTPLRLDGRGYRLPDGVAFSVQDARGLISVAEPLPDLLRRFLLARDIGPAEADAMIDALGDFTDADALRRLNGAEAPQYAEAGQPAPTNDWLTSPYELRRVLGWQAHPALWERASDWASAVRQPWVNPNTAPEAVLQALPGATPDGVAALRRVREQRHVVNAADLFAVSGIVLADDVPQFHPGPVYRLRLWRPGGTRMLEYTVMLTLSAPSQPWALLETRVLPRAADGSLASTSADPATADRSPWRDRSDTTTRDAALPLACTELAPE